MGQNIGQQGGAGLELRLRLGLGLSMGEGGRGGRGRGRALDGAVDPVVGALQVLGQNGTEGGLPAERTLVL